MVPLSLRTLHCQTESPRGTAAGGRIPAVGQIRHTGGARVLRAITRDFGLLAGITGVP